MNILVVEDCKETAELIKTFLSDYSLTFVSTVKEVHRLLSSQTFDLTLLDIELPDSDNFDFCSQISQSEQHLDMFIVVLSAKSSIEEKVAGLYSGADDYITKPFSGQELRARVEVCLRRRKKNDRHLSVMYGFYLDADHQKAFRLEERGAKGMETKKDLNLTPTEFRIFMSLLNNPGKIHSRKDLIKKIWSLGLNIETRGIDTHVSHLRKKLGADSKSILAVYGKGYFFDPNRLENKKIFLAEEKKVA